MNAEDLFRAIGQADAADLEHSEIQETKRKRILPRIGLIAAVVGVLCMTAMAIPSVRNLLFGIKVQQNMVAVVDVIDGVAMVAGGSAEVRLDVTIPQDAPAEVETAYVPLYAAENWKPIVEYRAEGAVSAMNPCNDLGWEDEDGNYVLFRQLACPGYNGDYPIEYVDLGFNADYEITALKLGDEEVQCITVQPSTIEGGESMSARDNGRRKIFWSDGSYLFAMEVNFEMSDAMLRQIYESIAPVEDVDQYREIVEEPAMQSVVTEVQTPYYPSALPDDWNCTEGGVQPDGSYLYLFNPEFEENTMSVLVFVQSCDKDYYRCTMMGLETRADSHTLTEVEINGTTATAFSSENENALLWKTEDGTFELVSEGPNCLTVEQLTQIAESLKPQ